MRAGSAGVHASTPAEAQPALINRVRRAGDVARVKESYAGQHLKELLGRRRRGPREAAEWITAFPSPR
ncbi:MAG: hypothetical protein K2X43_25210 [Hyphomonadaceae bacterium]|nr:hypothetical protein [Hyphomonadaceae bacterium]